MFACMYAHIKVTPKGCISDQRLSRCGHLLSATVPDFQGQSFPEKIRIKAYPSIEVAHYRNQVFLLLLCTDLKCSAC